MTTPTINAKIRFQGLEDIKAGLARIESDFAAATSRMNAVGKKVGDGITKSVSVANTTLKTTGTVGARSFGVLRTAAGGLLTVLQTSTSMLVSLGKAAVDAAGKLAVVGVGAVVAVNAFGIKTGEAISDLGKMAKAAGVPAEKFSKLASATRLAGGSLTDLTTGLQTLSDKIIDAAKGGSAEAFFKQIGVSVRDAGGNIKSTEQVLDEVADGLKAVPSDTLRASAAFDLFGTSATKLLPILADGSSGLAKYTAEADKLGTTVTDQQTRQATELLAKSRKVREALIGVSFKISDVLLPELTKNSDKTAAYLATNGNRIAQIVGKALKSISSLSADLARAFLGDVGKIERGWVRRLVPAFRTVKNVVADLLDIIGGGQAKRAPWLNDIAKSLESAWRAAKALGTELARAAGFGESKLPTLAEAAVFVRVAFEDLKKGISGEGGYTMAWVGNVGETVRNLGTAIGTVAGVIIKHKDQITGAAAFISDAFAQLVVAVSRLINGEAIPEDNPFAWLGPVAEYVKANKDSIVSVFAELPKAIVGALEAVKGIFSTVYGIMDRVAKAIGLDSGLQLGLILLILKFTGLGSTIQAIGTAVSTTLFIINGLTGILKTLWSVIAGGLIPIIVKLTTFFVGASAPVLVFAGTFAAIAVAIAGTLAVIWIFRDEIWEALKFIGGVLKTAAIGVVNAILSPIETFKSAVRSIGEWLGLIDPEEIAKPFEEAGDRIREASGDTVDAIVDQNKDIGRSSKEAAEESKKVLGDAMKSIEDSGSKALGSVSGKLADLQADATKTAAEGTEAWGGFWKSTEAGGADATAAMGDQVKALQEQYGLSGDEMRAAMSGTFDGLSVEGAADIAAATKQLEGLKFSAQDVGAQFTAGLKDGVAKAPDGSTVIADLRAQLGELPGQATVVGKDVSEKLKSGFADVQSVSSDVIGRGFEQAGQTSALVEQQTAAATAAMKSMWEENAQTQTQAFEQTKSIWSGLDGFFREKVNSSLSAFREFWGSFSVEPQFAYMDVTDTFSGLFDYFDDVATRIGDRMRALWNAITAGASDAMGRINGRIPAFGTEEPSGSADNSPRLATGGIIRGPGGPVGDKIRAWLSSGEGVVNARAVGHYGEGFIHAMNNLLVPKTHFATGGIVGQQVPASSGMGNLGNWNLAVGGQRLGQVYADRDVVRAVNRTLTRSATASRGAAPRWRT